MKTAPVAKLLIVRKPWVSMLATGVKTWELRRRSTRVRGPVGLAEAGTGTIVGVGTLVDVHGPYTPTELAAHRDLHQVDDEFLNTYAGDRPLFAWEFTNSIKLASPVPYRHPQGAVTWVNLDPPLGLPSGVAWSSLIRFADAFGQPSFDAGHLDGLAWVPSDELARFEQAVYSSGAAIEGFDWPAWQTTAERLVNTRNQMATASLHDCRRLLTTHVRKERFCAGHLADMVERGHITRLLDRIAALTGDDLYPEREANIDYNDYLDQALGSAWDD